MEGEPNKMKKVYSSPQKITIIDDGSSVTSSIHSTRLSRKRDSTPDKRKSLSRKSQQNSVEYMSLSRFYTKMSSTVETMQSQAKVQRLGLISRTTQAQQKKKVRSPTPVPGNSHKNKNNLERERQERQERGFQQQIFISQLQQKCRSFERRCKAAEKKALIFENEIKQKIKKVEQLQNQCFYHINKQKTANNELESLKKIANTQQLNLTETRTTLERLKKAINHNRVSELQSAVVRLRLDRQKLLDSMKEIEQKNSQLKTEIEAYKYENATLKGVLKNHQNSSFISNKDKQIQNLKRQLSESKEEKERFLQLALKESLEQRCKLVLSIEKIQIKINLQNRRKISQLQDLKKRKNIQLQDIRMKLSHIIEQASVVKKEKDAIKKQLSRLKNEKNDPIVRKNRFDQSYSDKEIEFSLSLSV